MISNDELIEQDFGPIGTPRRDRFEIKLLFWSVARDIVKRRREKNLSQQNLAKLAGLDLNIIKGIERGNVTTPIPNIHKIWLALGVPLVPVAPEEKPSHKQPITKQSPPLRTIVR